MIDQIKKAVHEASESKQKMAMFHYQVLKNAKNLAGIDPINFCQEIIVPETYKIEFQKKLGLARLIAIVPEYNVSCGKYDHYCLITRRHRYFFF